MPLLNLRASVDTDHIKQSSASNNKSISIFIPSKGDIFQKEKKDPLIKLLGVDKGIGSYEASLLLQNDKEHSLKSYGSKSYGSRKSKNSQGLVLNSLASKSNKTSEVSKGSYASRAMKSDSFDLNKINIESKPQSMAEERSLRNNMNNTSIIEVQVHSPINSKRLDEKVEENDVIANWLLSLVDFSRYLNRTCYHI